MMKKMKDRLHNKKGFTLVELIVVIVIILILAAVLIPNVMRYINEARESAFQSEASAYLTELQGLAAETYAKTDTDLATAEPDDLSGYPAGSTIAVTAASAEPTAAPYTSVTNQNQIQVTIYHGAVYGFTYADAQFSVIWNQDGGWGAVADGVSASPAP